MSRGKVLGVIIIVGVVLVMLAGVTTTRTLGGGGRLLTSSMKSAEPDVMREQVQRLGQLAPAALAPRAFGMQPPATKGMEAKPDGAAPDLDLGLLSNSNQENLYLIKTATLHIEVTDTKAAQQQLVDAIQGAGGYIGNLQESVGPLGLRSVTIQIRVPAERFDEALLGIEPLGKVLTKQVNTQDVSEEYVDTDSRARNLKKTEERLLDHLNKSARLEDTLRLEQELSRVRQEIERLEGRLRFLGNRVQFSSVQVVLTEAPKAEPVIPSQTFSSAKVASQATRSLVEFSQHVWAKAIWLGVWSPVWVSLAIVVWVVYRRMRRLAFDKPAK